MAPVSICIKKSCRFTCDVITLLMENDREKLKQSAYQSSILIVSPFQAVNVVEDLSGFISDLDAS